MTFGLGILRSLSNQLMEAIHNMPEERKERLLETYVKMASFDCSGNELWEKTTSKSSENLKPGLMRSLSTQIMDHVKKMPEERKEFLLRQYCKMATFDHQGNYVLWEGEDRSVGILRSFSR